jgi:endonuclease YncB( thermonuclease family)
MLYYGTKKYVEELIDPAEKVVEPKRKVLGEKLVRAGLAWWVKKYAPNNQALAQLHEQARTEHQGLWHDPNPKPSWRYCWVGK